MSHETREIEAIDVLVSAAWWVREFAIWTLQTLCIGVFLAAIIVWTVGLVG